MPKYRLGDIVEVISDREDNPSNSRYDRFVGLEHFISGDVEIKNYGETELLKSAMKIFKAGDILVARRNVYLKRASTVNFDGITSGDSIVLRAKDELKNKLLPFILNTDNFWEYAEKFSDGTMSKRLSPKVLLDYEINLPDIKEQEKLAELLWAANDTKESYKKLLVLTDELVKSQFIEMFGDPLSNVSPEGTKLGDICFLKSGKFVKADEIKPEREAGLFPCYGGNGVRGYVSKYTHEGEYPLIGRQGAHCGNVQYATGHFNATEHAVVVTPKIPLNTYWLYCYLVRKQLNRLSTGAAQPGLTVNKLEIEPVIIPDIEKQNQFADFAKQIDKSKFELQTNVQIIDNIIKAFLKKVLANN